jgi:hypothetical protein
MKRSDRGPRAPLKLVLPVEGEGEQAGLSTGAQATVEVSPVHSAPDAARPTFVPLALAIDLGQMGPIGSLTTTTIGITPRSPARPPAESEAPEKVRSLAAARRAPGSRRHLRLLPEP